MVVQRGKALDASSTRARNRRLEVRATAEDRQLIDRAVAASGTDLTGFVITHLHPTAQQVQASAMNAAEAVKDGTRSADRQATFCRQVGGQDQVSATAS
jgi:predicted subunit of tRNA(5-methylaminomethyl-2-thiouridylate) methyltransferase